MNLNEAALSGFTSNVLKLWFTLYFNGLIIFAEYIFHMHMKKMIEKNVSRNKAAIKAFGHIGTP